jgi:hypothetical protein
MEWRKAPLVGAPTGAKNGFSVLDIDPKGFGWYAEKFGAIPETRRHETPRGVHLLFRHAPELRGSIERVAPGVDVRAQGNYVIWWPREGLAVDDWPIADWPEWLLALAKAPRKRKGEGKVAGRSNVDLRTLIILRGGGSHLADALRQIDPRDFGREPDKDHYEEWFALVGACKAIGISREEFVEWSVGDPQYADHGPKIGRIWDSAIGAHGGAYHKALSERGIHLTPKNNSPGVHVPAEGNHSGSDKPSRRDWRLHLGDILRALGRKQTEPMLFWAGCVVAEIIAETGKPKVEVARGLLEGACPKLIREIGIAEVRRTIANGFRHVEEKFLGERE